MLLNILGLGAGLDIMPGEQFRVSVMLKDTTRSFEDFRGA